MSVDIDTHHRLLTSPAASQWQSIGIRHHHGVVVPLFSLHIQNSCGIGEYTDLLPLIDGAVT
jgi:4-alpha-glucanotransferase